MPAKIIKQLQSWVNCAPLQIQEIGDETLSNKPLENKWSKKEILGHLIDSAINNLPRFTDAQISDAPYTVVPYHPDDLVKLNDYQNANLRQLINLWQSLNQQIISIVQNIASERWQQKVLVPHEDKEVNLYYILEDYLRHLEHHLNQIFDINSLTQKKKSPILKATIAEALAKLAAEKTDRKDVLLFGYGTMFVEYYKPDKIDPQQPHTQDELYVVINGNGKYICDGQTTNFQTGDVLFAAAGVQHRFENFSDDFETWVIFYGPIGGEIV